MKDDYIKRNRVYDYYFDYLIKNLNQSIEGFISGQSQDIKLGSWNIMHLLVQLRNEVGTSVKPSRNMIKIIREKMYCKGVNTVKMEDIFPPSYNDDCLDLICPDCSNDDCGGSEGGDGDDGGGGGPIDSGKDGIDFMIVTNETSTPEEPINRIKK